MTKSCEPGQVRKEAAAAAESGIRVRLAGSATRRGPGGQMLSEQDLEWLPLQRKVREPLQKS